MNTTKIGKRAETAAANYLLAKGFKIIERNWHTAWCEIDIIAHKEQTVYFVEVKYRSNTQAGSGTEYVTQAKQSRMTRAAHSWTQREDWTGDIMLVVIEVSSPNFRVTNCIFVL